MGRDPRRTVILDTNIAIYAQDYADSGSEDGRTASEVLRAIGELGYTAVIAEATRADLQRGGNEHRAKRLRYAEHYPVVSPKSPDDLRERAGYRQNPRVNDECDLRILAALDQGLGTWLITNDARMIRHAERAGLTHVLDAQEFLDFVAPALHPSPPPPKVAPADPDGVNVRSEFFSSLTASYPEFYEWWQGKVVTQGRTTFVVGEPDDPQALSVIKENDSDYGLPPDTTKICTFKVSQDARGQRYGELLLKATLTRIRAIPSSTTFLEVAADNELVKWLPPFGFTTLDGVRAKNGDLVMVKRLMGRGKRSKTDPWTYHMTYGPGALLVRRAFLVPIRPHWHDRLFPGTSLQQPLPISPMLTEPCGNALTKMYISHTGSRKPARGDTLLFVETDGRSRISNIGVVEDVLVSRDPIEVLQFAGSRTVYTPQEIISMCDKGEVHVMRFRHDRTLSNPLHRKTPGYSQHIGTTPQSIKELRGERLEWVRRQLGG